MRWLGRLSSAVTILTVALVTAVYAANSTLTALSAASAISGANIFYVVQTGGVGGAKATATQLFTFMFSGTTGALKSNGSGTVTQAACADLSNAAASCSTDATNASNIATGTLAAARGGAGTITGALKGNGAGVVSQAACADLSNGATGCSTATGTSGATLPLLNGTNTWSGVQTFGNTFGAVSSQSGTTYTLASTDCGTEVAFTNAAAVTVTIPATLTTGCNIAILQTTAAGQVTVTGTAVSAATLHSAHSYTKTFGQWSVIGINIYTTGVAILTGDGA